MTTCPKITRYFKCLHVCKKTKILKAFWEYWFLFKTFLKQFDDLCIMNMWTRVEIGEYINKSGILFATCYQLKHKGSLYALWCWPTFFFLIQTYIFTGYSKYIYFCIPNTGAQNLIYFLHQAGEINKFLLLITTREEDRTSKQYKPDFWTIL